MTCSVVQNGSATATITVAGPVDTGDLPVLQQQLHTVVDQAYRSVTVDIRSVPHTNPAIVPVLLEAGRRFAHTGSILGVQTHDGVIARMLHVLAPTQLVVVQREEG